MNHRHLASLLLGSASLLAQGEIKVPRPFPVLPATKVAPVGAPAAPAPLSGDHIVEPRRLPQLRTADATTPLAALSRLQGVVFDDQAGLVWAVSNTWKASFDASGARFVPFLGAAAPHDLPVHFALRSIAIGGKAQVASDGEVTRTGNTIAIARGGVREEYAASEAGIEQRFVFAALVQRGELVVDVAVDGAFAVETCGDGFRFAHELGSFTYGKAVAIDGAGNRIDLTTEWTGTSFSIRVPAAFVAEATLPLVIDPLVGNVVTIAAPSVPVYSSDIAYDATLHQFVVCWEHWFSQTDTDVFAQRLDENMQPVGQPLVIDSSTAAWHGCRIAGLNASDKFLVVAQGTGAGQPTWVAGRMIDGGSATVGAPLVLASGTTDRLAPDVGGDPGLTTPTYFTIVWEQEFSPTDHDIYYAQVRDNGTLRATPAAIDASLGHEITPHISKSDGQEPFATQAWAVVYRRSDATTGQTRATFLSWDGQLVMPAGIPHMGLSPYSAPAGPIGLAVSSPTDQSHYRVFLVADTKIDPQTNNRYLRGTAVTRSGLVYASEQSLSYPTDPDAEPSLDCDGARFGLMFVENALYSQQVAGMVDFVGNQLLRREAIYITQPGHVHTGGIVAMHSGGAGPAQAREYGMSWHENVNYDGTVFAQRYRGMGPGGFGSRNTGCGPLTWSVQGLGAIGESITLQLQNTAGLSGWAFGAMVDVPLGFCPGCRQGTTADIVLAGSTVAWQIPLDTTFVGLTFALQGFDFAAGTCLGSLALSNTADLTIR